MPIVLLFCLALLPHTAQAQSAARLHNFEFGAAGVFPLSGNLVNPFSPGAGWRAGYELRPLKHFAADGGFTEAWPEAVDTCVWFLNVCVSSRQYMKMLDYGLRGVLPVARGRAELSLGLGGGYVWNQWKTYNNSALLQYSGKAAVALDRAGRVRLAFTLRFWRDVGRPTQQWISTTGGVTIGLGKRP